MNALLQVIDTGLDETSCFFIDEDGEEVEHGHYFEELQVLIKATSSTSTSTKDYSIFDGGYFPLFLTRRKVTKRLLCSR